jgi:DNA-binding NtrC family response regulator
MGKKILFIDDDTLVRKSLENFLKREAYTVVTAGSAQEAANHAAAIDFDVVISDVRMPQENGIVAIQRIK